MDLETLKAQHAAAKARQAKAALSQDEIDHAKLMAEIVEAEAEARTAEATRRSIQGSALEEAARKVAAGRYLVKYFDLAALLPEAPPEKLPGEGMLVVRSPPTVPVDALAQFYREVEAAERSHVDIYADLVCESVVYPDISNPAAGEFFRSFIESSIGRGTAMGVGDAVTALGGVRGKRTKRGRG